MAMRLTRPRHGDPVQTTAQLRELAAAVLSEDVRTLARTTAYLRRSYRTVFVAYLAMLVFGLAAVVAAFVKGLEATSIGEAVAAIGLCGLTVGIFVAFFVQRPSAALQRNAIFMPWVSIVLTTFWTRMLYLDDPATLDAKLGKAAKEASDELSAIAMRYAVIDGKELTVAKEAARTRPSVPKRLRAFDERLAGRQQVGVDVAERVHALEHDRHRVDRRVELVVDLVPAQRRRDRRVRLRPHGVDGSDRLALAVLVRVDQDAAPARLRPFGRRELRMRARDRAGDDFGERARLLERRAAVERHEHVEALAAGGLRERDEAELVEQLP